MTKRENSCDAEIKSLKKLKQDLTYFPESALNKDEFGNYFGTRVDTVDEAQEKRLKQAEKAIERLVERDSKSNIAHLKAIYNTIRVLGKGNIRRSAKMLNDLASKNFEMMIKSKERKGEKKSEED